MMKELAQSNFLGKGGEVWEGFWNGSGGGIKIVQKCFYLTNEFDITRGDLNEYNTAALLYTKYEVS